MGVAIFGFWVAICFSDLLLHNKVLQSVMVKKTIVICLLRLL